MSVVAVHVFRWFADTIQMFSEKKHQGYPLKKKAVWGKEDAVVNWQLRSSGRSQRNEGGGMLHSRS